MNTEPHNTIFILHNNVFFERSNFSSEKLLVVYDIYDFNILDALSIKTYIIKITQRLSIRYRKLPCYYNCDGVRLCNYGRAKLC